MRRILITGASRGIGRAIAEKLAAADVRLILHGRDAAALAETRQRVEARGATVELHRFDLADPATVEKLVSQISDDPLDVLVNNAGIAVVKPFTDVSLDEWQRTLNINVTAPFLLSRALAPRMPEGASIVNILSVAAKTAFPGWSCYCMSKFAFDGFSQSLREELRPRRIRVINVYPAATATEIWNGLEGDWSREKMMSAEQMGEAVAFALARPAEVAIENITLSSVSGAL